MCVKWFLSQQTCILIHGTRSLSRAYRYTIISFSAGMVPFSADSYFDTWNQVPFFLSTKNALYIEWALT